MAFRRGLPRPPRLTRRIVPVRGLELAAFSSLFALPRSTSVTGAAVAARIRREGYDWRPLRRGLPVPTIVIHGEADLLPVAVAREIAGTIGNARLLLLPGAGHMPFWEAPQHLFGAVDDFLSE